MAKPQPILTLAERIAALRLGQLVHVTSAADQVLRNNESGGLFEPGVPTPQTVTVTLLRRLQDGDLVLTDAPA